MFVDHLLEDHKITEFGNLINMISPVHLNSDGFLVETASKYKMMDMENSVILIAGLIPWCIACSVPLGMLGAGVSSVPFACYLYLLPLIELIKDARKQVYNRKKA